jgi:hypothetical protein
LTPDLAAGADQPRFLGRVGGYINTSAVSPDNLECVDEDEHCRQTSLVHRAQLRATQEAWQSASRKIDSAVDEFEKTADPGIRPGLRHLRRATRRVGHQVERLEPLDD